MVLIIQHSFCNNLNVTTPSLVGQNRTDHYVFIKFNIGWENSWRVSAEPGNWDASWVFVKYKVGSGDWQHATLNLTGHAAPSGSIITPSFDGKGIFVYRNGIGSGSVNFTEVKLKWNYGADSVTDNANITVKVFGIEMVYVATDSFFVGSGGTEWGTFTDGNWWPDSGSNTFPFKITSESALTIDHSKGNLWSSLTSANDSIGPIGTLSANFPKGYKGFYCMKYSSQEQYVDFLNSLTYSQQQTRTTSAPNSAAGTLAMTTISGNILSADRNGIKIKTSGTSSTVPAIYGCDLNNNGIFNESDDGQNISCNWLSWSDGIAFSDWSALRPMSELEFEKACRGPINVFQYERPYGSDAVAHVVGIANSGRADESYIPANGVWNQFIGGAANINAGGVQWGYLNYPVRVGVFATVASSRITSGATYYGIMDMAGNLWERVVTIGNLQGQSFIGTHGNGVLANTGDEIGNSDWPQIDAIGSGFRGGAFNYDSDWARTSDRDLAAYANAGRYGESHIITSNNQQVQLGFRGNFGFRGIRTAP